MRFKDKIAVVIGGKGGIGLEAAKGFAAEFVVAASRVHYSSLYRRVQHVCGLDDTTVPVDVELRFLEGEYAPASETFSRLLKADPKNELLQFKIALCLLLSDQAEAARKMVAQMKFPGDGPAWYYAQAALAIREGDPRSAKKLLASARGIFSAEIPLYDETFENLGWPTR